MKKLLGSNLAKWIAIVLTAISAIAFGGSLATIALQANVDQEFASENAFKERMYYNMCGTYSVALADYLENGSDLDAFSESSLDYSVIKNDLLLYTTDTGIAQKDYPYTFTYQSGGSYSYNTRNIFELMSGGTGYYPKNDKTYTSDILGLIYDDATALFYWNTRDGLYLVKEFYLVEDNEWLNFSLNSANTAYVSDDSDAARRFDFAKAQENANTLVFAGDVYFDAESESCAYYTYERVENVLDSYDMAETTAVDKYWVLTRDSIAYLVGIDDASTYTIRMKVQDQPLANATFKYGTPDYFYMVGQLVHAFFEVSDYAIAIQIVSLVFMLLGFVFLMAASGHRKEDGEIHFRLMDKCPLAIYFAITCGICACFIALNVLLVECIYVFRLATFVVLELECLLIWLICGLGFCMSIATRIKGGKFWRYTLLYYLVLPFAALHRLIHTIDPIGADGKRFIWKIYGIWAGISLLELFVIAAKGTGELIALFLSFKALVAVFLYFVLPQFVRVYQGGLRVANGDYSTPINTKHLLPSLEAHAKHINDVQSGIGVAVEERMKSERFKTELITNVSHDIKTPLTSIINYVDLMKKLDIKDETYLEYMEVLDRQSMRLKKLIEDLMEASKASTGNLEVHPERVNVGMIAGQLVGEYEEKAKVAELELILSKPEEDIYAMLDGRHIFRVLDNIMNNAMKYAQPGTRVYVDIKREEDMVQLAFRNTSKSQLNISAEELMERFTRGDSSRHTEGSGLGLNIAKSLTELMGGNFTIYVDGDLFKVLVSFPVSEETEQETVIEE